MTALTITTTDGTLYTPVMFVGGRCYPMLVDAGKPARQVSNAQRARARRQLGLCQRHGWSGHWQRR